MKQIYLAGLITLLTLTCLFTASAQAKLTVENNSRRNMTVKVMEGTSGKGSLYKTLTIGQYGKATVHFSETGYYFTKTKAILSGRDPVFQKGKPFKVVNDHTGYSVMTLTFSITESAVPQVTGGQHISRQEYEQN
jgi:hypothetical protein